jgi:urease accessory protein
LIGRFDICEVQDMDQGKTVGLRRFNPAVQKTTLLTALMSGLVLVAATPAWAHHAMDGKTPANFLQGFMAGLAHPVIGPDHFVFIVAVGLLAALKRSSILLPISFLLAAMLGTIAHVAGLNLPGVELLVSASILLFGALLILKDSPNTLVVTGLAAICGLFHGYAYGEAIFGATMTPLVSYLAGFTLIQFAVALSAFWLAQKTMFVQNAEKQPVFSQPIVSKFRSAGLLIVGAGLAFFMSQVIGLIFPVAG